MTTDTHTLHPGHVSAEHLDCIMSFSRINGDNVRAALHLHFVDGLSQSLICSRIEISPSLLSRKVGDVHRLSEKLSKAATYYPATQGPA